MALVAWVSVISDTRCYTGDSFCDNNRSTITDSIRVNISASICDNINDNSDGSIDNTTDNPKDSSSDITNGNINNISGLSIMVDWSVDRCNGTSI